MAVAGSLIVEIGANIAALRKDLEHSQKEIEKFRKQSETHAKTMESNWSTSIAGIKKAWVVGLGAMGTAVYAVGVAWRALKLSAEYAEQKGILDNLATKYNTTADGIIGAMGRASEGLISKSDLMQNALEGVSKGLRPDQLIELSEAARVLGDAVGKDATTALNELTQALETGRVKGLKNYLGTALDLEAIFGNLTSKLTAAEKAQALYSITMIETRKIQASMNTVVDETADKMERLEAKYKDTKLALSNLWKEAVVATVAFFDSKTWANDNYINQLAQAKATEQHTKSIREKTIAVKESLAPYEREIAALKKIIQTRGDDEKKVKSGTKEVKQSLADQKKAIDALEDAWVATDNAINSMTQDVERGVDITLNGIERIKREQEEAYRKWMHDNGTLFDGIRSGFNDSRDDMYTWFDAGREGFYAFASDSSNTISSVLFDTMTGDLKSFGDYWKSFWESLLKTFTDIIAKMVVQWAMGQAAMMAANAGWSGLGSALASAAGTSSGVAAAGASAATGATATSVFASGGTAGASAAFPAIAGYPGYASGSTAASGTAATGTMATAAIPLAFVAGAYLFNQIGAGGRSNRWATHGVDYDPTTGILRLGDTDLYRPLTQATRELTDIRSSIDASAFISLLNELDVWASGWPTMAKGQGADAAILDSVIASALGSYASGSITPSLEAAGDAYWQRIGANANAMFGLAKGMDYVPRDNYPALLHEGEAVLTKRQASAWRGSGETHIHFHGMVIDANACQEFAYEFAPYMHKAFAQGH